MNSGNQHILEQFACAVWESVILDAAMSSERTLAELETEFPFILWRDPQLIRVTGPGKVARLCCRVCIANQGLKATEVERIGFTSLDLFRQHFYSQHDS